MIRIGRFSHRFRARGRGDVPLVLLNPTALAGGQCKTIGCVRGRKLNSLRWKFLQITLSILRAMNLCAASSVRWRIADLEEGRNGTAFAKDKDFSFKISCASWREHHVQSRKEVDDLKFNRYHCTWPWVSRMSSLTNAAPWFRGRAVTVKVGTGRNVVTKGGLTGALAMALSYPRQSPYCWGLWWNLSALNISGHTLIFERQRSSRERGDEQHTSEIETICVPLLEFYACSSQRPNDRHLQRLGLTEVLYPLQNSSTNHHREWFCSKCQTMKNGKAYTRCPANGEHFNRSMAQPGLRDFPATPECWNCFTPAISRFGAL